MPLAGESDNVDVVGNTQNNSPYITNQPETDEKSLSSSPGSPLSSSSLSPVSLPSTSLSVLHEINIQSSDPEDFSSSHNRYATDAEPQLYQQSALYPPPVPTQSLPPEALPSPISDCLPAVQRQGSVPSLASDDSILPPAANALPSGISSTEIIPTVTKLTSPKGNVVSWFLIVLISYFPTGNGSPSNKHHVSPDDIEFIEHVGTGSYGDVWLGKWNKRGGGTAVAIKKIKVPRISVAAQREVNSEVNIPVQ
jgi:hypothetical protein